MSLREIGKVSAGALILYSTVAACASAATGDDGVHGFSGTRALLSGLVATAQAQTAPETAKASNRCSCEGRRFVGYTVTRYTIGLGVPGTCSLQPFACLTDGDCANQGGSGGSGVCVGAQDFGDGFLAADARCSAQFAHSVVCTSNELLESVRAGLISELPSETWYNSGNVMDNLHWSGPFTSPAWPLACCS
jgi:hypothetical protein